jgi:hypothetical protein
MPILRKNHNNKYTIISNEFLQNPNISLKAKGLLCFMLSCSEEWKFSIDGLAACNKDGRSAVMSALDELEELGYHKKERLYEDGKIKEWVYYISETPIYLESENLNQENLTNKKEQKKKDIVSKDTIIKKKNLYEQCVDVVQEIISDNDVQERLIAYLSVRIKDKTLSAKSWETMVNKLYELADTKELALQIIQQSIDKCYRSFYPLSYSYRKKDSGGSRQTGELVEDKVGQAYHEWAEEAKFFGTPQEFRELVEKGEIVL